jgi:hypothetical protein
MYKVVQIWPGLIVCKQVTVCPGHIWTTLYVLVFHDLLCASISVPKWGYVSRNFCDSFDLIAFNFYLNGVIQLALLPFVLNVYNHIFLHYVHMF